MKETLASESPGWPMLPAQKQKKKLLPKALNLKETTGGEFRGI